MLAAARGGFGRRWLLAGLLILLSLGGLLGRRTQLRRHRLRQLHLQWGADRHLGTDELQRVAVKDGKFVAEGDFQAAPKLSAH